jgi:hypothetical protein
MLPIYQATTFNITHHFLTGTEFVKPAHLPPLEDFIIALTRMRILVLEQSQTVAFNFLPSLLYDTLSANGREITALMGAIIQPYARSIIKGAPPESRLGKYAALCRSEAVASMKVGGGGGSSAIAAPLPSTVEDYLVQETTTLLFAGLDTSAGTLSFATLHLCAHPLVNKDDDSERAAFIKETMRLTPVAEFVMRPILEPVKLLGGEEGVTLPVGALACVHITRIHTNPLYYARPAEFLPQRWLERREELTLNGDAFIPFGVGSRNCIGSLVGKAVVKALFDHIVSKYTVAKGASSAGGVRDTTRGFTTLPREVVVKLELINPT